MDITEIIIELLKYITPAALVIIGMYFLFQQQQKSLELKERRILRKQQMEKIMPLRLQAYERLMLFLERINPQQLILRCDPANKDAGLFSMQLEQEIRAEFEHNIVQQLYVSEESWQAILLAKEQLLKLIEQTRKAIPPKSTAVAFGRKLVEIMVEEEVGGVFTAIQQLKADIRQTFRL